MRKVIYKRHQIWRKNISLQNFKYDIFKKDLRKLECMKEHCFNTKYIYANKLKTDNDYSFLEFFRQCFAPESSISNVYEKNYQKQKKIKSQFSAE